MIRKRKCNIFNIFIIAVSLCICCITMYIWRMELFSTTVDQHVLDSLDIFQRLEQEKRLSSDTSFRSWPTEPRRRSTDNKLSSDFLLVKNVSSAAAAQPYSDLYTAFRLINSNTSDTEAEAIFHQYITVTDVKCPTWIRLGNIGDGGWNVCIHPPFEFSKPCLVYSFGINNDWSFDDAVSNSKAHNCTVRAFDPSMTVPAHRRGDNIWFYKYGIGGVDKDGELIPLSTLSKQLTPSPLKLQNFWNFRTLSTLVHLINDTGKVIDYLKIDVEYSEWSSLEATLLEPDGKTKNILNNVKQLGLEVHVRECGRERTTAKDYTEYSRILAGLRAAGFVRWDFHRNQFGMFALRSNKTVKVSCAYEIIFLNENYL